MMNSELHNQQSDWLAQTEELNDIEASQVNGGESIGSVLGSLAQVAPEASSGKGSEGGGGLFTNLTRVVGELEN
jgi:hypothetical protein